MKINEILSELFSDSLYFLQFDICFENSHTHISCRVNLRVLFFQESQGDNTTETFNLSAAQIVAFLQKGRK
jgi:hypothetical protein